MPKIDHEIFDQLGEMLRPPPPPKPVRDEKWLPHMTVEQKELFYAEELFILLWGEKGGAKTWAALDKMVKHCFDNQNALGIIGVRVRSMANKGGAWDKLMTHILPEWKEGMGLDYSDPAKDSQHNDFVWIQNRFGSWSCIVLITAPTAKHLYERMPGYEPSMVFWDELTKCPSEEYFKSPSIQLGRRPGVRGRQQFIGACNPLGPSNWVYQTWFVTPYDEETDKWDPRFRNIYFPIESNVENLQPGYRESLLSIYKNDPIERQRMVDGQWVDRPTADALFRDLFNVVVHVMPLDKESRPDQRNRLRPVNGHPIIVGMDPGSVYNAFVLMQWLPFQVDKETVRKWMIFDEAVTIRRRISYRELVAIVQRKVKWWRELVEGTSSTMGQVWMSDNSAFNQYRAAQGSYDVLEMEKFYNANRTKFGLEALKIKQCPKFNGSRVARVQLLQNAIAEDKVIVSSGCPKVIAMFNNLEGEPQKAGKPFDPELVLSPRRSDHLHVFDALTYPMLAASISASALVPMSASIRAA